MKEFIFNENQCCINPNRYECGDKEFWIEIQTACYNGKWYHGHQYWTHGHSFEMNVYKDTYSCQTESEAICKEIVFLVKYLKEDFKRTTKYLDVSESIFKELSNLKERAKHPQLSIF